MGTESTRQIAKRIYIAAKRMENEAFQLILMRVSSRDRCNLSQYR